MQFAQQKFIFDSWLSTHKGVLFKVVRTYAFTRADQEDLFQEIAAQVWISVPAFKGSSAPSTWIYRVALNTAISWSRKELRRRKTTQSLQTTEERPEPELNRTAIDPRLEWLYEKISLLSEIDRSLALLLLEGFSYQDMAEALGLTESNVGVRIHRIKAHLTKESTKESRHAI